MIIFGTRGVTYAKGSGDFHCPSCGQGQYRHRRVRRFFTLYFIPLIPMDLAGEYVECVGCENTYDPEVLSYDPTAARARMEAEYHRAVRRVMALMLLADGVVDDEEIATIQQVYQQLAGAALSADEVQREIERAGAEGLGVTEALERFRGRLNDAGKEMVVRAAFLVAAADGEFAEEEQALLDEIAAALEMSPAHVRGVLAALSAG